MVAWVSASGFAKLLVSADKLELRVGLLGRYTFGTEDVVSVTRVSWVLYRGIRIEHCISSYPRGDVVDSCAGTAGTKRRTRQAAIKPVYVARAACIIWIWNIGSLVIRV
jgi:hypothetical protein